MTRYPLVYGDPAWNYRDKANAGKRGASHQYKTIPRVFDIAKILDEHCANDCTLFLWETPPTRDDAIAAAKMIGFKYRTVGFTWVKTTKDGRSTAYGMGHWTRANAEQCTIWTRGKKYPRRVRADVEQIVFAPLREPSRKPDEVRDRIVQLMGDIPRIEMFARSRHEGWEAWGNETEKFTEVGAV